MFDGTLAKKYRDCARPPVFDDVSDLIGDTPIFRFKHPLVPKDKELLLKLEWSNPGFSIKDRTALGLIKAAIAGRKLRPGGTIVESSSGNLGKSLAMLSASMGFHTIIVVDPKVSRQTLNCYRAFGAKVEVVDTPDARGSYQGSRIRRVKQIIARNPDFYWPNQYDNSDNPDFHASHTEVEIRDVSFDLLVGSVSTGGHLSGIARALKRSRPCRKILACDVEGSVVLGGSSKPYALNGVGLAWRSKNTDLECFDGSTQIGDVQAISMCREIARTRGLLLGGSAGLCVFGALSALRNFSFRSALAILPDTGANYLDQIYDDLWIADKDLELMNRHQLKESLSNHKLQWRH